MTVKKKSSPAGGDRFLRRSGNLRVRRERRWKKATRRGGTLLMLAGLAAAAGFLVEPARSLVFESEMFRVRRLIFHARDRAELEELTDGLGGSGYCWAVGRKSVAGPMHLSYAIGTPAAD